MARLYRDLLETLAAEIIAEDRQPGTRLPKEVDLATEFEVSRGTAREGIRALQERGLVDVVHGKGAIVTAAERWDVFDPDVLAASLRTSRGLDVIASFLECRRLLELPATALAAERATVDQQAALAEAHDLMKRSARRAGPNADQHFHRADQRFHQALMRASGNPALAQLVERIHSALFAAQFSRPAIRVRFRRAIAEHQLILDGVIARDPIAARQAAEDHLDGIGRDLAAALVDGTTPHI